MAGEPKQNLTNRQFTNLHVEKYLGRGRWECTCSCGKTKITETGKLLKGLVTSCGHDKDHSKRFKDITDEYFGEWQALQYEGSQKWLCRCSCGVERIVDGRTLRNGLSTNCGHERNELTYNITGGHFGEWEVLEYIGNQQYLCRCSCGTIKVHNSRVLRRGQSHSCGCKKREIFSKTMMSRYGDTASWKAQSPRTIEQQEAIQSKQKLMQMILSLEGKPTIKELSDKLGIIECWTLKYVHKFGLDNMVDINPNKSKHETELETLVKDTIPDKRILTRYTGIIHGKELDIYIPELKTAIEFNGTYWHSSEFKEPIYHQNKSISCWQQGVRLIHIFEYEWFLNRKKIEEYLRNSIVSTKIKIQAKNCDVKHISEIETKDFLDTYHLQGYKEADIYYGLYCNDYLLEVMTFKKLDIQSKYSYELVQFVTKHQYNILGGAEKLLNDFVGEYTPQSIVTYCDASKFTGRTYTKLGFKLTQNKLTPPKYVWVGNHNKDMLLPSQTSKQDLVKRGLGNPDQTEGEIMGKLGYLKVYDCGNFELVWNNPNPH